jgi:TPR repeat protein
MRKLIPLIGAVCLVATSVYGQDCKDGQAAHGAGDYAKALSIYKPLADKGDACSQYQLGEMYMQGKGVPEDKGKALELFKKAAAQGDQRAKLMVGFLERK